MMFVPSRCGSFCKVHVLKSLRRVWESVIWEWRMLQVLVTSSSFSCRNWLMNFVNPTGIPRRQNPSVTSPPMMVPEVLSMAFE